MIRLMRARGMGESSCFRGYKYLTLGDNYQFLQGPGITGFKLKLREIREI